MDLSKIKAVEKADEGAWLTLLFVDGTELDAKVKLAGMDSITYRDKQRVISMGRIAAMQRNRNQPLTPEIIEEQGVELLAACVLDWEGFENEGEAFPLNAENVMKVLKENLWIREQVDVFIGDRRNFLAL